MRARRLRTAAVALVVAAGTAALVAAGCGEDGGEDERTRLEQALETIPGKDPVGSGYAWIDVERMREAGGLAGQLGWAHAALGPGAGDLAEPSPELTALGVDTLGADAVVAVTSNYPSSVRFDGTEPAGIERTLSASAAEQGEDRGWRTFDLGAQRSIPLDTPAEPLGSLGARVATRAGSVIFARSDIDRSNMIGRDEAAIDADPVAAGADCLGDVIAARFMLNNHTHLPGIGPDLMAFGVLPPPEGPRREVLCAIDADQATVDEAAAGLERTFEPGGRDRVSGEPIQDLFSAATIESYEGHGLAGVRVALEDAPGAHPGQLFGAFDRGSLVTYMGLQPPPLPDDLTRGERADL
jgi:hypothetical protein